jgi:CspA family cold shock protein
MCSVFQLKGKIKKYLSYRGFGFIEAEGRENDIFFHVSNYPRTSLPTTGQEIEFTLTETPKGEEATDIQAIEKTAEIFNTEETKEEVEEPTLQETEVEEIENLDKLPGIGPKYQELLRAARIKSIDKLAKEDPEKLFGKLNTANMENGITKRPPNLDNVVAWINLAKDWTIL